MKRRVHTIWAILTSALIATTGCRPQQPFYLHDDGDLSHYLNVATDLEYPDVDTTSLDEVTEALPPMTLTDGNFTDYWDLTLEEAIQTTLKNTKVMRSLGGRYVSSAFNNRSQTGDAPDAITTGPEQIRTVYDPAIAETTPFNGVEYALSAFDTQWSTNLSYQKNDRQQNVLPQGVVNSFFRQVFQQDTSTFNTQLSKVTAQGGQFSVRNNIVYDFNNNPTRQVPKDWNANYEVSFNQPLLSGAGTEYNRIAGPFNPLAQVAGAPQSLAFDGVVLARINVDISLADFEGGVRNLVNDTEQAYWELSFAWRNLETANTALNSARQTWQKIHVLFLIGTKGGEAKEEAQAREQFYQFKSQTQTMNNELYRAENRLRYIMGLAATDGRLIRPIDRPTVAKVDFDWREINEEALARNLDLRRQKWRIKQRELELIASKNLLLPRLDVNGTYRWLGLGDNLFGTNATTFNPNDPFSLTGSNALQTLASGQFQEWALGGQMTMSLGFRRELAQVRHFQLQLAKERAKLQDEELEISHQLTDAWRQMEYNYEITQTNFNRTLAADRQVEAVAAAFEAQTVTLDQLLEAQRRRAEAQVSFFRTLLDYQRSIVTIHYRKGSLLEYNNVYLAEGPWPDKAKFDAHRLARQRDAGVYLNYGYSRPDVISQGGVRQNPEGEPPMIGEPGLLPEGESIEAPLPRQMNNSGPEELPSPDDMMGSRRGRPGMPTASNLQRGFEWGELGIQNSADSAEPKANQNQVASHYAKAEPAPAPRAARASRSVLKQPKAVPARETKPASPKASTAAASPKAMPDDSLQSTKQQWKAASKQGSGLN